MLLLKALYGGLFGLNEPSQFDDLILILLEIVCALCFVLLVELLLDENAEAELLISLFDPRVVLLKHLVLQGERGDRL